MLGPRGVRGEGLVEVPPAVGPASDLDDVAGLVEVIVDGVGIGDEVALVAGEEAVDGRAVVLVRIAVEDVAPPGRPVPRNAPGDTALRPGRGRRSRRRTGRAG